MCNIFFLLLLFLAWGEMFCSIDHISKFGILQRYMSFPN